MKRKFFLGAFILLMTSFICGCTPKAKTIYCQGLGGEVFEIKYSIVNSAYDGVMQAFSVKDTEAFTNYLINRDDYKGKMEMADSKQEVFLFEKNSQMFFCVNVEGSHYKLSACRYVNYDSTDGISYLFAFPPIDFMSYRYNADTPMNIETIQDWAYFSEFYQSVDGCTIDELNHTVELPLYCLSSVDSLGKAFLEYTEGGISYQLILKGDD